MAELGIHEQGEETGVDGLATARPWEPRIKHFIGTVGRVSVFACNSTCGCNRAGMAMLSSKEHRQREHRNVPELQLLTLSHQSGPSIHACHLQLTRRLGEYLQGALETNRPGHFALSYLARVGRCDGGTNTMPSIDIYVFTRAPAYAWYAWQPDCDGPCGYTHPCLYSCP